MLALGVVVVEVLKERFCSICSMQSKLSAGFPSLTSTHWHSSFISLVSAVNLAWLLGKSSSMLPPTSSPPKATIVSEPLMLSLSIPVASGSSTWRLMSLSMGCPAPPWWVAIACILYTVQ